MQQGRGGMGSRKHGRSGHATKSPRFRLWARRDAERRPEPSRPKTKYLRSIRELFSDEKIAITRGVARPDDRAKLGFPPLFFAGIGELLVAGMLGLASASG